MSPLAKMWKITALLTLVFYVPSVLSTECSTPSLKAALEKETVTDNVALVWFPTGGIAYSTTNVEVDKVIWSTILRYIKKGSVEKVDEEYRSKRSGYFRFGVSATQQEIEKLRTVLEDAGTHRMDCVTAACDALRKAGILKVPFPFNRLPVLSAAYLGFLRILPNSRVNHIEYVGVEPFRNVAKSPNLWVGDFIPLYIAAFGAVMAGVAIIQYSSDDDSKKKKKEESGTLIVPISSSQAQE